LFGLPLVLFFHRYLRKCQIRWNGDHSNPRRGGGKERGGISGEEFEEGERGGVKVHYKVCVSGHIRHESSPHHPCDHFHFPPS
jgi:hypothetical protein